MVSKKLIIMSEIRISKIDDDYFVNDKKVIDPLSIPILERIALDAYKKHVEAGLQIKSTFTNPNKDEKSGKT